MHLPDAYNLLIAPVTNASINNDFSALEQLEVN